MADATLTARPYGPCMHRYMPRILVGVLAVLALMACGNPQAHTPPPDPGGVPVSAP